jgi:hypothetical protein
METQLKQTPNLAAMYEAMDQFELMCRACLCDWDGSPDAKRSRIGNPECPVHKGEDEEDGYERARR